MSTLKDLLAQRQALDEQIRATQAQERATAIAQVRSLMAEFGLTVADLAIRRGPTPGSTTKTVAAKYRNDKTGETWSGRGLQPKWLKAAIAGGATLDEFRV